MYRWDHYYKVQALQVLLSIPNLYECIWERNLQSSLFLYITNLPLFYWNANITTAEFKQERKIKHASCLNCCSMTLVKWLERYGKKTRNFKRDSDKDWNKLEVVCLVKNIFIHKSVRNSFLNDAQHSYL